MYLITQSLLSSWGYLFSCGEGGYEKAEAEFMQALNREPIPPNDAMIAGSCFEKAVYAVAAGNPMPDCPQWESGVRQIAAIIQGAQVQVKTRRPITVDGTEFFVYGVLDALKAGVISDVKYKVKNFQSLDLAGSYLDSPQHPAYLYMVPEAREFQYLVSDGTDLYIETYTRQITRSIGDIIGEFKISMKSMGLFDLYMEKWCVL